jgi:transcriptional regulator with XRE-family HTH domain
MPRRTVGHTGDPFQDWLRSELEARDWSYSKLARELDVFKGTVSRWLADHDDPAFRRPSLESYRRLGEVFGVDPLQVMGLAGIEGLDVTNDLSPLKRDIMSTIIAIPDDLLVTVYPQLRALMDEHVQVAIREASKRVATNGISPAPKKPASKPASTETTS